MKLKNLVLLSILAQSLLLFGQTDTKQFRKKFDQADVLLNIDDVNGAIPLFLELWNQDSTNANLNYKLGLCYIKTKLQKNKAIPYFEKSIINLTENYIEFDATEKGAPYKALYLLAKSHHYNNQFENAIEDYTSYLKYITDNGDKKEQKIIEAEIERCKHGALAIKNPTKIKIENLGENINSIYPDYAPLISADESVLIFTTRRKSIFNENDRADGKFNDDIYISYKENNEWQEAKPLSAFINTNKNDATVGLSADGQQLFLYKEGDIYVSKLDGDNWNAAVKLNENINTKYFEPSATISADGKTLYFVSDRKGGFGGRDIYKSLKLPDGDWGIAQNLGPNVNTEFDEDGPFISFDGKSLYFSSVGHQSIGGYDLFVSKLDDSGNFQNPENLGFPVNTTDDDVFFVTTPDEKHGYYSSSKEGNIGETDIYRITFEEKVETEVTVLVGKIINKDGGAISPHIEIVVNDVLEKQTTQYYRPNVKTGKYIFSLTAGSTYEISYLVDGVEFDKEILDVPEGTGYQVINREVFLKAVAYGNEHLQKAKTVQEENNSKIDTTEASIKVSGMSSTAIALVNHLKSNDTLSSTNNRNNQAEELLANNANKNEQSNTTTKDQNNSNKSSLDAKNVNKTSNSSNNTTTNNEANITTNNNTSNINTNSKTSTNALKNNAQSTKIKAVHFLFGFNQSSLSQLALNDLKRLAKIMKKNPNLTLEIEGHTDSAGSDKYNKALSERRAKSVKNYLVSLGVPASRIKPIGTGELKPIAINANENGVANKKGMMYNRRIDLILSENQEEFIEPLIVPDDIKIKTNTDESIKTKF